MKLMEFIDIFISLFFDKKILNKSVYGMDEMYKAS